MLDARAVDSRKRWTRRDEVVDSVVASNVVKLWRSGQKWSKMTPCVWGLEAARLRGLEA